MSRENPEYLEREEPARVPIADFKFRSKRLTKQERREVLWQNGCLAEVIANASDFNTANDVTRNNTTYGGKRIFEDGTTERIIGCSSCGAMCTIVTSDRKEIGPGTEEDPNLVISVAEAPQPNPWAELGTFDDCKAGKVTVPQEASALTQPVGLTEDSRMLVKILSGRID